MNQFGLAGRILEEPVKSLTSTGIKVAKFKLCVDKIKEDDKSYEIYEITVFRQLAELELVPGQYVGVTGKLNANNHEKDDNTYFNVTLIGNSVTLLGN